VHKNVPVAAPIFSFSTYIPLASRRSLQHVELFAFVGFQSLRGQMKSGRLHVASRLWCFATRWLRSLQVEPMQTLISDCLSIITLLRPSIETLFLYLTENKVACPRSQKTHKYLFCLAISSANSVVICYTPGAIEVPLRIKE
jgi:hypothetical protein